MGDKKIRAVLEIGGSVGSSVGKSFAFVRGNTKKLGASLKDLEHKAKQLKIQMKDGLGGPEAERALAKLEGRIKSTKRHIDAIHAIKGAQLGSKISGLGSGLATSFGLIGGAALGAGAAIYKLAQGTGEYADSAAEHASALRMQTNSLIEMKYAAEDVGTEGEALEKSLAKMQLMLEKARKKGGGNVFKLLHLDAVKLSRQKPEEQIGEIAEAFKNYNGKVSKTAIAMALFGGKGGAKMVNFLNLGKKGLKEYANEAKQVGLTLDEDLTQAGDNFDRSQKRLGATLIGTRNIIGKELLPVVNELLDEFSTFLRNNAPEIRKWAQGFARDIRMNIPVMVDFAKKAGETTKKIGEWVDSVGGAENVLKGLLLVGMMPTIAATASFVLSIGKIINALATLEATGMAAYGPLLKISALGAALGWVLGTQSTSMGMGLQNAKAEDMLTGKIPATPEQKASARDQLVSNLQTQKDANFASRFVSGAWGLDLIDKFFKKVWGVDANAGPTNKLKQLQDSPAEIPKYLRRRDASVNDNRTFNVTVNPSPGMDEKALADLVMARLAGRQAALAGGALYD